MPHFRVDDGLDGHPKTERAGDDAMGMWVRAGSWCMRYLTDGFVPEWWVKKQPKGMAKARNLVAAGFWISDAERDGEKGFQFHEFTGPGRQDSREKIEADRELARRRKAKSRDGQRESQARSQRESQVESHRDNPRDGQRESRRSPGYTQPNPTQPLTVETLGGKDPLADARVCARHPDGNPDDEPCGGCRAVKDADARARREAADAAAQRREDAAIAQALAIVNCDQCDDDGYRAGVVCGHNPEQADTNARGMAAVRAALAKDGDQ